MSRHDEVPYAAQSITQVASLLKGLEGGQSGPNKKHGVAKRTHYAVEGTDGLTVDSWKFKDWDYKRDDLPTYARGLFTSRRRDGTPEIAARGYDKFFNVDEVNDTRWSHIETQTCGPYELSVKENGCIIFLSGLEGDHLLVCSKHATGAGADAKLSHSLVGERWVDRHLQRVGRTRQQLARELRRRNATAVAELCDDSFEEHVLAYDPAAAGLYLHGINLNLPEFTTYSGTQVHHFADEWGFKKAQFLVKDDLTAVKKFLEECAETGSWNGRDTEGFVVRCRKRVGTTGNEYGDWFFKFKFEEPYLMYRQWREATKAVIAGREPKIKKHKQITEAYLKFARQQLAKDPELGKAYNMNHGIIKMRDDFLKERGLKGSEIIQQEMTQDSEASLSSAQNNVVLATIATIGCGKTTTAVALAKLFQWGHVQNDNITGTKGRPARFVAQLGQQLAAQPVVIADRNNHQKRERKQLIDDVSRIIPDARFVALHYVHDPKSTRLPEIRRVTQARVLARGDNHQTIHAGSKSSGEIIGILEGFLQRFEPYDPLASPDEDFHEVIHLDPIADSRTNLETIVRSLHASLPKLVPRIPLPEELDRAMQSAMTEYAPDIKHQFSFGSSNGKARTHHSRSSPAPQAPLSTSLPARTAAKMAAVEYFCIRLPTDAILQTLHQHLDPLDPSMAQLWRQLLNTRRVQARFHITLLHRAAVGGHRQEWARLQQMYDQAQAQQRQSDASAQSVATYTNASNPSPPSSTSVANPLDPLLGTCRVRLQHIVWDERLMAMTARLLDGDVWVSANAIPHVTIGTRDASVKPKESNDLLARWAQRQANTGSQTGDKMHAIPIGHRGIELVGHVHAVTAATR